MVDSDVALGLYSFSLCFLLLFCCSSIVCLTYGLSLFLCVMDVFAMDMVDVSYTNEWNDISNFKYATLIDQAQLWHGFKQNIFDKIQGENTM